MLLVLAAAAAATLIAEALRRTACLQILLILIRYESYCTAQYEGPTLTLQSGQLYTSLYTLSCSNGDPTVIATTLAVACHNCHNCCCRSPDTYQHPISPPLPQSFGVLLLLGRLSRRHTTPRHKTTHHLPRTRLQTGGRRLKGMTIPRVWTLQRWARRCKVRQRRKLLAEHERSVGLGGVLVLGTRLGSQDQPQQTYCSKHSRSSSRFSNSNSQDPPLNRVAWKVGAPSYSIAAVERTHQSSVWRQCG